MSSEDSIQHPSTDFVTLASDIVSAYVSRNHVSPTELPALLVSVHGSLQNLATGVAPAAAEDEVEKPTAAQIRKSITHDGLISFIDGKSYKTLKRHLTGRGLDPRSYRARYGLPNDYPMVAPSYAAQRSELARAIGLGRVSASAAAEQPKKLAVEQPKKAAVEEPKTRGRRRAA
ncbi:hypothetical protein BHAOGJBA_1328 [Methylobacterium hispanicum]|uniref:MucR family transcriptional regulator n=1 Tax=Methylobacterium hispanicum TaxID=270350 RepID=A0AAV4ZI15_9HYPH|nr:hypothetical protein BHAOGJBA_1328 [Methylobacterium hispanicum]